MYFLDNNSGIATMPPLKETQSTTPLWFTEGDGNKGISWPGEDWFNIQQAEQLALLDAAGIRPDKGKLNQLTLAIRAIIGQEALLKTQALAEIAAAGKGAQEKARTHLGLGKLATQDGIQEATLHRKGIVQLNSSPRSADETTAATPKAVNERVNAVVDKAPSDLDTLNKLAQAISNNPKFAESVTQLLSQKLAKNENGADISNKNQFVKNLGLTETIDCAKNALDQRTGGTVNGDIISQGTQISLKGDNRKHLGIHNQDGSVRMWLYKDKGGDGVRLNNGNDGGGEYVFHKDGGFRSPSSVYAGAARIASDGNIYGSQWGNQWLDAYLKKTFQPKGACGQPNTAKRGVNGWWKCGDTGLIIQWGKTDSESFDRKILPLPLPFPNEGLWALGWVAEAIGMGEDLCSHSAGLVDRAHIKVTTDYNLDSNRILIMYYYSPGENAFFPEELKQDYIRAGSFPKDTIEVGDDVWLEFAGNLPPKGKQRIVGTDGFPAWGDRPPPTKEDLMSAAEKQKSSLMQIATVAIAPLQDAADTDMATDAEKAALLAWKKYRVLLNRVDISTAPDGDMEWPQQSDKDA